MFSRMRPLEPPLHEAIIQDSTESIQSLFQDPAFFEQRDSLGFTPVELAQYLNREKVLQLIQPTQRSLFVRLRGKEKKELLSLSQFEAVFQVKYLSHLHFQSYYSLRKIIESCPLILKSRFGQENRDLYRIYGKYLGTVATVSIEWINDEMGYGIFALEEMPKEHFIGEYTGLVRHISRFRHDENEYCFQYPTRFWSWNYNVIDALKEGNETRFINHSEEPNLKPICLLDRNLLHSVLVTNHKVKKGEQLTFDYGPDFWRKRKLA